MSSTCSVTWCAALPVDGSEHCAVHKRNPKWYPVELAPDEELIDADGTTGTCETCDGKGNVTCEAEGCKSGLIECECSHCYDVHDYPCEDCGGCGTVPCEDCLGHGTTNVRKKGAA